MFEQRPTNVKCSKDEQVLPYVTKITLTILVYINTNNYCTVPLVVQKIDIVQNKSATPE